MLLATSAQATDCGEISIEELCAKAEYTVVGRLSVYSRSAVLEDNGTSRNRRWVGGELEVKDVLKGQAPERLTVEWLACCPEEEEAIEMASYFKGSLSGVWFVFDTKEGGWWPLALWRPHQDTGDVLEALKRLPRYKEH